MKFGFVFPYGPARQAAEIAREAEQAGWDGFFVWEPVWGIDAWVSLAAAAMLTEHIRLGTILSPLSRMRPWKLASETVALDHLSNGRLVLSVGLGAVDTGFEQFGEITDRKTRAELLDEGLGILTGLWRGQPFRYDGKHYHVRETSFRPPPPPVQQPRIPIWVVGAWPHARSMQRALRYDGLLPNVVGQDGKMRVPTVEEVRILRDYVAANRPETTPYDIIVEGQTPGDDTEKCRQIIQPWSEAGATWWIEALWDKEDAEVLQRLRQGPAHI